jgi:hypothetical protein
MVPMNDRLHDLIQRLWRDMDSGHSMPDWTIDIPDDEDEEDE